MKFCSTMLYNAIHCLGSAHPPAATACVQQPWAEGLVVASAGPRAWWWRAWADDLVVALPMPSQHNRTVAAAATLPYS